MPSVGVTILGVREATALLERLGSGARAANETVVRVGHTLAYAWGIHFGRDRGGKLRRAAGGTFHLTGAFEGVQPRIAPTMARAIQQGPAATAQALHALGLQVEADGKQLLTERLYRQPVPRSGTGRPRWRRTGNLRADLHTVVGRG